MLPLRDAFLLVLVRPLGLLSSRDALSGSPPRTDSSYSARGVPAVVPQGRIDRDLIAHHIAEVMRLLGLNAEEDPELAGTPDRVADLWVRQLGGARDAPPEVNVLSSPGDQEDMVLVREMPFLSTCAHHWTPFFGTCSVAYIPGESLVGVSVPAVVLDHFARRPQIQERLGEQVASYLAKAIEPRGVMVHLVGRHLCMEIRGIRTPGVVETTATRGWFSDKEWRTEFFERLMARGAPPRG